MRYTITGFSGSRPRTSNIESFHSIRLDMFSDLTRKCYLEMCCGLHETLEFERLMTMSRNVLFCIVCDIGSVISPALSRTAQAVHLRASCVYLGICQHLQTRSLEEPVILGNCVLAKFLWELSREVQIRSIVEPVPTKRHQGLQFCCMGVLCG